ncbi:hypothetical protein [Gordonia sihwensis]|uniref:hypothetical protein n=1 Tax=Gordonia sihwensis TaxID=173559 RepID=UPI0005EF3529|nr:hypothetical protein [Gordonia sihwensis]KJR10499.1 hypothetical protein UG54_00430 [Gordonia sihwensis]
MPSLSNGLKFLAARRERGAMPISRGGYPAPIGEIVAAQQEGAAAVHAHITPGDNPYVADHSDVGRFLALMWFRGYRHEQGRLTEPISAEDD